MGEKGAGSPGPSVEKSRIRLLSSALVDQIAAGEVVERPASVVKELVENALDAGAEKIRVEVRDGGAQFLSVTDDGSGMNPEEVRMALKRHATSKLSTPTDLERIRSFGFRGEALPSIASVSRFRILSRARGSEIGYEMRINGGEIEVEREAGGPVGTRVEVADLFSTVPARRKFLKRPGTEWGHISDWLGRLALALPGVHFEVQRDDRKAMVWPACRTAADRIAQILPTRDRDGLVEVEWEEGAGHLHAFGSSPEKTRANGEGLYLYVNGRPVRDKLLRSAVFAAYRDVLPRGRFPTAVVFVTVPPETVDVNVHPAKWEVRFADPQAIHQLIRHGLRDAMTSRRWLADRSESDDLPSAADGAVRSGGSRTVDGVAERAGTDWVLTGPSKGERSAGLSRASSAPTMAFDRAPTPAPLLPDPRASEDARLHFADLPRLGQIKASYLVLEGEQGLILVDQHAAHERVLYEDLRSAWIAQGVSRQGLLAPISVALAPLAMNALIEGREAALQLGFEFEPFGEDTVVVRAVPALLSGRDPETLIRELAEEMQVSPLETPGGGDRVRILAVVDRIFATLACHSARRFGDHLEAGEQSAILEGLDRIPWAPTCPHGRPVAISLDMGEIEKRFSRR